jgi:hypothetical protein
MPISTRHHNQINKVKDKDKIKEELPVTSHLLQAQVAAVQIILILLPVVQVPLVDLHSAAAIKEFHQLIMDHLHSNKALLVISHQLQLQEIIHQDLHSKDFHQLKDLTQAVQVCHLRDISHHNKLIHRNLTPHTHHPAQLELLHHETICHQHDEDKLTKILINLFFVSLTSHFMPHRQQIC